MTEISVTRDDHDWLLELGKKQGISRIMSSQHEQALSLIKQFRPPAATGLSLPWDEAKSAVRFQPGRVTIWSGPTFSGKTGFLRQLMLHAYAQHHKVLFVSLEEEPVDVWREFICMSAGTRDPTPQQRTDCLDLWDGKIFVFDSTEMIEPTLLMGIIRNAVETHKINHVVVDSLMRLDLRMDDYEGQRVMGNMLGRLARLSGAHIHLVAHPRKNVNSRQPMDLYDIGGAQSIVAQADLVLTLERKYGHEISKTTGQPISAALTIWKQRGDTNWVGNIELYFDPASRKLMFNPLAHQRHEMAA